ncbi:MAG: PAS domain S-box protein [Syntrophales bacterium]|jgi:PAS domain S-box-containing protein/putative nucleotidyltransferase with HDIG domain|nr:PAS domain S-box protein [Syntrophales bacterium]MDY0044995.1 PAS domain S-box protein [Syntrophales bacterium]
MGGKSGAKIRLRENKTANSSMLMDDNNYVNPDANDDLYDALAKSSQTGIYIVQDSRFQFVNPYILNYSGYSDQEWIGKDAFTHVYPGDREKTRANAIAMLKGQRKSPYEYRVQTKKGDIRWVLENIISIKYRGRRAVLGNTMDVTDEKKAKSKLVEAEKLYRDFANNTQTGVFVAQKGKVKFANPHLLKYSRYETMEDLLNSDLISFVHPEDREITKEHAKQMLRGERAYPYEYRMITKDGSVRWILETVTSIDYYGEPAVLGSSIDITQLIETTEHLIAAQALESSILSAIPHAVIGLENRKIIFANDSVEAVFGWKQHELIGQKTRLLYRTDEDYQKIAKRFYPVLEREKTYSEEFPCRRKDGTDIICMVNTARVGEVLKNKKVVVVYEDITERKNAEQALRESEEKYAAVVEQAMDGIIIIQNGIHRFANRAISDMSGYSVDELVGMPFDHLFESEYSGLFEQGKKRTAGEQALPLSEAKLLCNDGSTKDVEIAFGIIKIDGKRADMGYVRDITFRKKAQDEIKRTVDRLKKRLEETVNALASIAEKRDPYTAGHQQRVAQLAEAISREMNIPDERIEGIVVAATLHDIGKIYEPSEILSKPDILTDIEFLMMKVHPEIGFDILKNIEFPWPVAQIVRQHHERINGSGYPDGLKDKDILLEAKILAVADVVEAMASHRPYRSALGVETALKEISKNKGILYDREVANACLKLFRKKNFAFTLSGDRGMFLNRR